MRIRLLAVAFLALAGYAHSWSLSVAFAGVWLAADPYGMEIGPRERAAHRAQVEQSSLEALTSAHQLELLAVGLAVLGLALAACAEWRARNDPRRFPWRSLSALALLGGGWLLGPERSRIALAFIALGGVFAALDLRLRRPGPLRALAFVVLALAVVECVALRPVSAP